MPASGKPMLFAPPRPPLTLPATGAVVIGRSRRCDLKLGTADASRRHAEIVAVTGGYVLRDMGSTNGTFVNGERVEERQLTSGDRIEIGGDLITYCEVDPQFDAGDLTDGSGEAQTLLAERPALGQCIQGNLAEIPSFALLQMLELGHKSGVLEVETGEGPGHLWLHEGSPVHASTKSQRGFDAAVTIVQIQRGQFAFEPNRAAPDRTITASATELLLEASRQLDEA